jgi:glutamate-1-semialdehyde aminotransferase
MAMPAVCSSAPAPADALRSFDSKTEAREAALEIARAVTGRSTVITVPTPYTRASLTLLCHAMAEASERIAALVVELEPGDDAIYGRLIHKARELASAEGAVLVWCETVANTNKLQGGSQSIYRLRADLTCLTFEGQTWLCGSAQVADVP